MNTAQFIEQTDIAYFFPLLSQIINQWYISIPVALALLFASRLFPKIVITVVGFIAGIGVVYPLLSNIVFIQNIINGIDTAQTVFMLLTGVLIAAAVFALFKFVFFLVGLLGGYFIGIWLYNIISPGIYATIIENNPNFTIPFWISFAFAGFLGVLVGILAWISQEKAVALISDIIGSLILSFYGIYWLITFFPDTFGRVQTEENVISFFDLSGIGILIFVVMVIVLCYIGNKVGRPRRIET